MIFGISFESNIYVSVDYMQAGLGFPLETKQRFMVAMHSVATFSRCWTIKYSLPVQTYRVF